MKKFVFAMLLVLVFVSMAAAAETPLFKGTWEAINIPKWDGYYGCPVASTAIIIVPPGAVIDCMQHRYIAGETVEISRENGCTVWYGRDVQFSGKGVRVDTKKNGRVLIYFY